MAGPQRDNDSNVLELVCPACGALIEAETIDELIVRAKLHTKDAHDYDIPAEHVIQTIEKGG